MWLDLRVAELLWRLLLQAQGGSFTWEELAAVVTALTGFGAVVWGLLAKGTIRFGWQVDKEQKILQDQIATLQQQIKDERAEGEKRLAEYVAAANQRLAETIVDYRGRVTDAIKERDDARQHLEQPMEIVGKLVDVVEQIQQELKRGAK